MSHKQILINTNITEQPSISKDTLYGLGRSTIFDETFLEKHKHKKQKMPIKTKGILSILIYIICSVLSTIFIKHEAQSLSYYQSSFLQSSCSIVLIPLSSLQKIFLDRIIKHRLSNEEEKDPAEQLQEESFSELMNKKNYEHFYKYSKSYYRNILYLIICYFISLTFHYWTLHYLNIMLCLIYFTINSVTILLMKCIIHFHKTKLEDICQIILNIGVCVGFYICYHLLTKDNVNYNYKIGTVLAATVVAANTAFLYFWKSLQKKYKFYINTTEVAGYMGLFSLITAVVVVVLVVLFKDGFMLFSNEGVFGVELFKLMAKVGFCGVVVDFALMKMVDYCSFGLVSNTYNVVLGVVFGVYWGGYLERMSLTEVVGFVVSEGMVGVSVVVMVIKIISSNQKRK